MSKAENIAILQDVASKRNISPAMMDVLQRIISRESSNWKSDSKNENSSARGLFQFIDSTWLGVLKAHGHEFGLGQYAPHIHQVRTDKGPIWTIRDPALKTEALALKNDPRISCEMGIAFTRDNVSALRNRLEKEPTAAEIYLAHFLGCGKAIEVLKHSNPEAKISTLLSGDVMWANRDVKLKRGGKETLFRDFTVADIQIWAAGKMDQPLSYEQLSRENQQRLWRQKHPRTLKPGEKDDFGDMVESLGDMAMTVFSFIGMCIVGAVSAIGSIFSNSDNSLAPPLPTPTTSQVAAVGTAVPERS